MSKKSLLRLQVEKRQNNNKSKKKKKTGRCLYKNRFTNTK